MTKTRKFHGAKFTLYKSTSNWYNVVVARGELSREGYRYRVTERRGRDLFTPSSWQVWKGPKRKRRKKKK